MADFHIGGHVPVGSNAYVARPVFEQITADVLSGHWALLLGPRQHGKTSGLIRMILELRANGIQAARFTTQTLAPGLGLAQTHRQVARALAKQFDRELAEPGEGDREELESWLSRALPEGDGPCVVVVDEAAGISDPVVRGAFFRQLRAIHDSRDQPWAPNLGVGLAIVFAGTFSPQLLAGDSLTSPFNVCVSRKMSDLTRTEVHTLLSNLGHEALSEFVDPTMELVGGQPFLVQYLLQAASGGDPANTSEERFARACETLKSGAGEHLQSLLTAVVSDPGVREIAGDLVHASDGIPYVATPEYEFLEVVGLGRLDEVDGRLYPRSELYAYVGQRHPMLARVPAAEIVATTAAPPSLEAFAFVVDDALRTLAVEMCSGGFAAAREGRNRLSVIAIGSAVEAVLIDFLECVPNAARTAACGTAGANWSRFEDAQRPATWRLVNLIKVAQCLPWLNGARLVSTDDLREWRNLVHPELARARDLSDGQLDPEANAAMALLGILLRELAKRQ